MKMTRLGLRTSHTINMGNYESIKIETWVEAEIEEGETVEDCRQKLREELVASMNALIRDYIDD